MTAEVLVSPDQLKRRGTENAQAAELAPGQHGKFSQIGNFGKAARKRWTGETGLRSHRASAIEVEHIKEVRRLHRGR